jgi:shikimate kinase
MTRPVAGGHLFLIGFMGAGKSTVGRLIAAELGRPFVDLDAQIERDMRRSCSEIFAKMGEEAFRALETEALAALAGKEPSVVACGGGIILRNENRRLLGQLGTTVYLEVTAGEALARIGNVKGRPLLAEGGPGAATTLLQARGALYHASADVVVDTAGRTPNEVARDVLAATGLEGGGR